MMPAVERSVAKLHPGVRHGAKEAAPSMAGAGSCDVALFVLAGVGNLGNDASLAAMIETVRARSPASRLMCVCGDPHAVSERFGIAARPINPGGGGGRLYHALDRVTLRQLGHLRAWWRVWKRLSGIRVLVFPGTGVLDDFGVRPFGFPYRLLMWCTVARLRGARIAFVSTGAGPIDNRLSRSFMLSAARLARYRSYRDTVSQRFMEGFGIGRGRDPVYPDLVFGMALSRHDRLGPPVERGSEKVTIGVGVMNYHGWTNDAEQGQEIRKSYVKRMAQLIHDLLQSGYAVHLLFGVEDRPVIAELNLALEAWGVGPRSLPLDVADTLEAHARHIAKTDIVIGTRYHTVIAALALARPVIALGYAEKFSAVMDEFGLSGQCEHAERFLVADVIGHIDGLVRGYDPVRRGLEQHLLDVEARLREQEERLAGLLTP